MSVALVLITSLLWNHDHFAIARVVFAGRFTGVLASAEVAAPCRSVVPGAVEHAALGRLPGDTVLEDRGRGMAVRGTARSWHVSRHLPRSGHWLLANRGDIRAHGRGGLQGLYAHGAHRGRELEDDFPAFLCTGGHDVEHVDDVEVHGDVLAVGLAVHIHVRRAGGVPGGNGDNASVLDGQGDEEAAVIAGGKGCRYVGWDMAHTAEYGWVMVEGNGSGQLVGIQTTTQKGIRTDFEALMSRI